MSDRFLARPRMPSHWAIARTLCIVVPLLGWNRWLFAAETSAPNSAAYGEKLDLVRDASVADSLERQKNLNFSSVRIDGEKTSISLSALTADQILNVVATKVPTPDLDADTIGGELQLTSRR